MPRTKAPKKKVSASASLDPQVSKVLSQYKTDITSQVKKICKLQSTEVAKYLRDLDFDIAMYKSSHCKILNMTIGELKANRSDIFETMCDTLSGYSQMNATKSKNKSRLRRSMSLNDDGYLTAESTDGASSTGRSRSRDAASTTTTKKNRKSRSLSRSKLQNYVPATSYITPQSKLKPMTFGNVTPKVKPNTPSVLLRRPKQGEVAISLQGSPLMVNPTTSDEVANINIPLEGGRMLCIQPQKGLRMSQIPAMDDDIRQQLRTLRDNLNKVCAVVGSNH